MCSRTLPLTMCTYTYSSDGDGFTIPPPSARLIIRYKELDLIPSLLPNRNPHPPREIELIPLPVTNSNHHFGREREDGSGYYNGRFWLGEYSTYGEQKGALRFNSVAISRGATVLEANIVCTINGRLGSTTIPLDVWGIDEDNTSDFGSSPFGRSKTTATKSESVSGSIGAGEIWEFGITTMAQEIVNRGSWNSGNHMGFIMESKNNTPNSLIDSDYDDLGSSNYLKYRLNNNLADYKYTIFLGEIKYG